MLFNSNQFLIFFAVIFASYLATFRWVRVQNALLLVASYWFYGAWDWRFLSLIFLSTLVDYLAALAIEDSDTPRARKLCLAASVAFNLGTLGFFKYYDFGISSFSALLGQFGLTTSLPVLRVVLPVGISFYTFQTMSYTIDVYRRKYPAERNFWLLALYVAYFPQLVAGPIERAGNLLPQLARPRRIRRRDVTLGLNLLALGYFKKVVLADSLAPLVNEVYDAPGASTGPIVLLATLGFAVQIYGDFAGYSQIARGIAHLMGIELMANFRRPYLAESPRDFWRRWHISLSTWLSEYLYVPLGGSRHGQARTYVNLMITMMLGGLWHGAAWNFVLWGVYHGILLVACHAYQDLGLSSQQHTPLRRGISVTFTLALTLVGWILFRCSSLAQIGEVFHQLVFAWEWTEAAWYFAGPVIAAFALLEAFHYWQERADQDDVLLGLPLVWRCAAYTFLIVSTVAVGFRPIPFIYFQF